MAVNHSEYLAATVLNEGRIVTYRALSRALKIHVTLAKQILFEFHQKETAKTPGCVHATYLVCSVQRPVEAPVTLNGNHAKDGDDDVMQSSPFMSSAVQKEDETVERVPVRSVLLVREEELERVKRQFETISSIHVYSLEPRCLKDLQVLSDSNREIASTYSTEDPLVSNEKYGTILNPNVKRRTGRRPNGPQAASTAPKADPTIAIKKEASSTKPAAQPKPEPEPSKASTKPNPPKRETSDIFASFAKSKSKPKLKPEPSTASATAEDSPMRDASDDEDVEDEEAVAALAAKNRHSGKVKAEKGERERRLKEMMDVDEPDPSPKSTPEAEEEPNEEAEPAEASPPAPAPESAPSTTVTSTSNGRRRGKRRVTRRKTVKDDEGYLVTREEHTWESFSEDEPAPVVEKKAKFSSGAKKGASQAQGGQGNLMSFFKKK